MSAYICNFIDGSVKTLDAEFNMANCTVSWYRNLLSSTMLPWYVSIKGDSTAITWDVEKAKSLGSIPTSAKVETIVEKYVEKIDVKTGYTFNFWWAHSVASATAR